MSNNEKPKYYTWEEWCKANDYNKHDEFYFIDIQESFSANSKTIKWQEREIGRLEKKVRNLEIVPSMDYGTLLRIEGLNTKTQKLESENKKFREALEKIIDINVRTLDHHDAHISLNDCERIAESALKETQESEK